jgi:hypothetical protein
VNPAFGRVLRVVRPVDISSAFWSGRRGIVPAPSYTDAQPYQRLIIMNLLGRRLQRLVFNEVGA